MIVAFKYIEWVMRCRVASIRGVSWELTGQKSCLTGHHDRRNMNRYFEFWNHCILLVRFSKKVMLENIAVSLSEFRNCFPRSISWFAMSMSQFRQSLCPMSLFHFLYVVNQGNFKLLTLFCEKTNLNQSRNLPLCGQRGALGHEAFLELFCHCVTMKTNRKEKY